MKPIDVYLSSGYLSFAAHLGFLKAIEDSKIEINSISGISSGAIVGALFSNGIKVDDIRSIIEEKKAIEFLSINRKSPYNGLFNMTPLEEILSSLLPMKFDDMPTPFRCGVIDINKNFENIDSGFLIESIIASCSVPFLFVKKSIPEKENGPFADGGVIDRIGPLSTNRKIIHLIDDTFGKKKDVLDVNAIIINSKRSGSSLWRYKDFSLQFDEARKKTAKILKNLG